MLTRLAQAVLLCAAACGAAASSMDDPYTLVEAASERAQRGDLPGALQLFHRAAAPSLLSQMPQQHQAQVLHNLGFTLHRLGRLGDALDAYTKAIARAPMPDTHVKAAYCANAIGQTGLSAGHLVAAIKMSKGNAPPTLYLHLGDAYNNLKRHGDAVKAYRDGLARVARAAGNSKAAIKRDPTLADLAARLYQGVGDVLVNAGNYTDALRSLNDAEVYYEAAGAAAAAAQKIGSKRSSTAAAVPTAPPLPAVNLDLAAGKLECLRSMGAWEGYDALVQRTERALAAKLTRAAARHSIRSSGSGNDQRRASGASAADEDEDEEPPPFAPYAALFLDLDLDPLLRRNLSAAWTAQHLAPPPSHAPAVEASNSSGAAALSAAADGSTGTRELPAPPLRLGLMSRRFHHYPGTHLMLGLFARFDRTRVSVHCFATGPDGGAPEAAAAAHAAAAGSGASSSSGSGAPSASPSSTSPRPPSAERSRLARDCDTFDDASALSAPATAALIRSRAVDVLLDYDGAHDFNNLATLAHAPAGVSASWLGFAGPVGYTRARAGSRSLADGIVSDEDDDTATNDDTAAGDADNAVGQLDLPLPPAIGHRYSVVDAVIAPPESAAASFAESLVYLPHTYQPQNPDQDQDQALTSSPSTLEAATASAGDASNHAALAAAGAAAPAAEALQAIRDGEGLQLPACAPPEDAGLAAAADGIDDAEAAEAVDGGCSGAASDSAGARSCAAVRTQRPFVMSSFNRLSKLDERMWAVWTNALRRCGGHCLLWLYAGGNSGPHRWPGHTGTAAAAGGTAVKLNGGNGVSSAAADPSIAATMGNIWAQAAAHGVHPSRIVFAGKAPRAAHLRRLQAADVQLDSRVYGAHTTAADGLFSGVPLVTAPGSSMASRVGLSLLRSAGVAAVGCSLGESDSRSFRSSAAAFGSGRASVGFVAEAIGAAASLAGMEERAVVLTEPAGSLRAALAEAFRTEALRAAAAGAGDDTASLLTTPTAASVLKQAITGAVARTRVANARRHVSVATTLEGATESGSSACNVPYCGVFDAAGFAATLARASRAMHEARYLTGPDSWTRMSASRVTEQPALPRLSREVPHVVLLA